MTFNPFRDFETRGYLRNLAKEKDPAIVKRLEHASFTTGIDEAFAALAKRQHIQYEDVLKTHKILFGAVYPWAGQDRTQTAPGLTIKRGKVLFANPSDIRRAIEFALHLGQDKATMIVRPGCVLGHLAFGHPFLDGNGRTILTVHSIMAQRAGISIDWSRTEQSAYLDALTEEIEDPKAGALDSYLRPFIGEANTYDQLPAQVTAAPGLDRGAQASEILGDSAEPAVKAQYDAMLRNRERD